MRLNTGLIEGTMGLNPAWRNTDARNRNVALVTQFDSAVARGTRRIAQCQLTPSAPGCAPIVANPAGAQAVVSSASAFAAALSQLYGGRAGAVGLPFVPVGGSAAHLAITQRVLGFRDQFTAMGVSAIGDAGPTAAPLLSPADLATLLTDTLYGYSLRRIRTVHAYGVGELALHAKVRVFDMLGADTTRVHGFKVRQALGAALRLNGGSTPDASEPFAPVTGDGGSGVTLRSFTDLFYGERWSASIVAGYERSGDQSYAMRVPAADAPQVGGLAFPIQLASREVQVTRTPGARIDLSITPRVALARNVWLGLSWQLAQQAADGWSAAAAPSGTATWSVADLAAWAAGTDWSEQRLSLGGTYSTVAAVREGRAKLPFDVTYEHVQTLAGRGWRVAHLSRDVVTVRWYPRLWGGR
ncbi:MAG: hypothetical protein H3C62_11335 [Gemmatimonadaceae bacterium]|nr:hypothetical protein [Gemmatimonadaceae bacterium]